MGIEKRARNLPPAFLPFIGGLLTTDPVKSRVALLAADPPDNAKHRHSFFDLPDMAPAGASFFAKKIK
ncbi:hypothetical protein [Agrobacterium tumefaciens]|uniref:hypothetical protein n=1 Tax=Agrobacterium tumefaciens TaxID=358 RepID=UPI0015776250|nr:hypothetical protein [Agrobacterium tumefaciens]NTZ89614.1 hypothetical protein [Agrobacterium tumefaciens]